MNFNSITKTAGRAGLLLKKHGPTIAFSAGVVGSVASTVMACKATLKLAEELPEMKARIEDAKEPVHEDLSSEETEKERLKDIAYIYGHNTGRVITLYSPAVIVGVASIGLLTGSHVTLNRRNAGLTAGYAALQQAYDEYRRRVAEEIGKDVEHDIYRGVAVETVKVDGKNTDVAVFDPNNRSPYSRIFDECSSEWQRSPELNRVFLDCQQRYMNHRLQAKGHVFLNEVYDALGFERTTAGAVVGWVVGHEGDNYIDFGIFNAHNSPFVNGIEPSIILDFNVDGVIYDKI